MHPSPTMTLQKSVSLRVVIEHFDGVESVRAIPPGERAAEKNSERRRRSLSLLENAVQHCLHVH